MSNEITITFPKDDVRALFRSMSSAVRYLGYDTQRALRSACKFLVQSVGTSTKVAPKLREYRLLDDDLTKASNRRGVKTYLVRGWFGKPRSLQTKTVRARSVATLKREHVLIKNRGLARKVWSVASSKLGGGQSRGFSGATSEMTRRANRQMTVDVSSDEIRLTNALPYASEALDNGERTIDTAMARAASGMMKSVETALVRRMGLGSLSR